MMRPLLSPMRRCRAAGPRKLTVIALCAASVISAVAPAEPPLGSRLGERTKTTNLRASAEALRSAHRLAECMFFKRAADVRGFLTSQSDKDRARHRRNLDQSVECRNATLTDAPGVEGAVVSTSPDVWRGMLAEAALEKTSADEALQPLAPQPSYEREWFMLTGRDRVVDEMAVCVADQTPAGVRALLATKPEGPEELAAVQALSATLGPCLPTGATLKANRQSLRAALAEALYHRAAPVPVPLSKYGARAVTVRDIHA